MGQEIRKEIKGMKSEEFKQLQDFVQKYHKFALWLSDEKLAEARKLYPKLNEHGKNIKYIDSVYDSRFSDVWSVSFRGMGNNLCFHTNTDLDLPFNTLYEWIMAFLTGEWVPNTKESESIIKPRK